MIGFWRRWRQRRRVEEELASLSAHELRDIGLNPYDLHCGGARTPRRIDRETDPRFR
jgi:uncharacterized protein YjiS (DUF1127 family)